MKPFLTLLMSCGIFGLIPCEAKTGQTVSGKSKEMQRQYIDPQAVSISGEGIFLHERGKTIPVRGVAKDENGFYIVKEEIAKIKCWYCRFEFEPHHVKFKCPICTMQN